MNAEYFDGQMPENKKPDLQWMTAVGHPYRHLMSEQQGGPVAVCGSRAYVYAPDVSRRACPQCLSIALNNISSVTVAVPGGYNYLPEESEPMADRIPLERIPNPRVPKRPLLQNPHEEPQTYSLAQVLLIRDYLMPYIRTAGYSERPDEKALDELLRAGAFDTDRVLILAAEAEQEKARKAAEREAAKRSPKPKNKNSEPSDEDLSAMLDADAKG